MTNNDYKLRNTTQDWMLQLTDRYTHAVTLTLKPYRTVMTEHGEVREKLTIYDAKANMRHFINRLNAEIFGNAAKRYGKSIAILPVLEGIRGHKFFHYHCAIGNLPESLSDAALHAKVRAAWQLTHFGNEQIDVQRMQTTGWIGYMGKELGRGNTDALDLENLHS